MSKSAWVTTVIFLVFALGLTACGSKCGDACDKLWACATELEYDPAQVVGTDRSGCHRACVRYWIANRSVTDCVRNCNTGQICPFWGECVEQCGLPLRG